MSIFVVGIILGMVIMAFIFGICFFIANETKRTTDAPPPSEGWTYTKSTNKPAKRPVPPKPEPRLGG